MESFDADFEAALREAESDMGREPANMDPDPADIALEVHHNRLTTWHSELCVRGNVTEAERKEIEAMRQALSAYAILQATNTFERAMDLALAAENLKNEDDLSSVLTDAQLSLAVLDNVEDVVVSVLAGLGLTTTWNTFIDYDRNRCRIEINPDSCILADQHQIDLLDTALKSACKD